MSVLFYVCMGGGEVFVPDAILKMPIWLGLLPSTLKWLYHHQVAVAVSQFGESRIRYDLYWHLHPASLISVFTTTMLCLVSHDTVSFCRSSSQLLA